MNPRERNDPVLKTVWGQPHGGSNPSASANKKRTFVYQDKGAFFELSVPQAEREVCFASEARLRLVKRASRDKMRNT